MQKLFQAVAVVAVLAVTGCGQGGATSEPPPGAEPASSTAPASSTGSAAPTDAAGAEGCDRYTDTASTDRPLLDVLADDPQLSWFHSALTGGESPEVDLTETLSGGPVTVFAPVDDAVVTDLREELREDPAALRFYLGYHIVPDQALSPQELVDAAAGTGTGTVPTLTDEGLAAFAPRDGSAELALSEDAVVPPLCQVTVRTPVADGWVLVIQP